MRLWCSSLSPCLIGAWLDPLVPVGDRPVSISLHLHFLLTGDRGCVVGLCCVLCAAREAKATVCIVIEIFFLLFII